MSTRGFHSAGQLTGLTNARTSIPLGTNAVDARAEAVPSDCDLASIQGICTLVAGGATTITHYVSEDAAGDRPITPEVTDTILGVSAGKGGFMRVFNYRNPYRLVQGSTAKQLYLQAHTDVGTCTITVMLRGRVLRG